MSKKPWLGLAALVTVCSWGTLVVGQATAENEIKSPARSVIDLALANGTATGIVVDDQGTPVKGAKVAVKFREKTIARVVTNKSGEFEVRKMRGGLHTIHSGGGVAVARLWTEASAPPTAKSRLTVVSRARLIRGQCGEFGCSVGDATGGMGSFGGIGAVVQAPAMVSGCADGSCGSGFGGWGGGDNVLYYDANCNPVYSDMNFGGWGLVETAAVIGGIGVIGGVIADAADDDDDAPASP